MKDTLTLEFDNLPTEAARCSACLDRLGERLNLVTGIASVEMFRDRRRVVIGLRDASQAKQVEALARKIMAEVSEGFAHETLRVGGMDCPGCAAEVQGAVGQIEGVRACSVDFPSARMYVEFELGRTGVPEIRQEVRKLGFSASPIHAPAREDTRWQLITLCLGGILWLVGWHPSSPAWADPLIFVGATAISGWRMLLSGLTGLFYLKFSTNTLMALAVVGALALGEWKEGSSVAWLFALGNYLQARTMLRTRGSVKALLDAAPRSAFVRRGAASSEVDVRDVLVGDLVEVRPFCQIPVDGEVVEGDTLVDNSSLTGENEPIRVSAGSQVLAGGVAKEGFLLVRATKAFSDSTYSKTLEMIERGQSARAPQQETLDRVTSWYTPAVIFSATLFAVVVPLLGLRTWADGLHQAFWLLMVACPCALVISIPVAAVTAIGAAGRMGALVRGGVFLESLSRVRHWVFDKTGTLTYSRLEVVSVICDGISEETAIAYAASLAKHSSHPVSRALVHLAGGRELPAASDVRENAGAGMQGLIGGSEVRVGKADSGTALSINGEVVAQFEIAEGSRFGAKSAVSEIHAGGASVILMSGDRLDKAQGIGGLVGADEVIANATPEQKASRVAELAQDGGVAMVGDGVNDTAALQRATVGIAMGAAGSDSAIESADIVLLNDDIENIPRLLRLSRTFRQVVAQNIAFSLATKAVLLAFGAVFVLPFWLSVVGDMGVSLLVTMNALRLRN